MPFNSSQRSLICQFEYPYRQLVKIKINPTQIWYDKFNLPKNIFVFSEYRKILKVRRSPKVSMSLPHLPPLTAFFSWGRNILFQISGGEYAQVGHMHTLPTAEQASEMNKGQHIQFFGLNWLELSQKEIRISKSVLEYIFQLHQ